MNFTDCINGDVITRTDNRVFILMETSTGKHLYNLHDDGSSSNGGSTKSMDEKHEVLTVHRAKHREGYSTMWNLFTGEIFTKYKTFTKVYTKHKVKEVTMAEIEAKFGMKVKVIK